MEILDNLIDKCRDAAFDLNFTIAKNWKKEKEGRVLVGYMPIYFPRELVHAAGGMAVGILGGGDRKQIIKGDAYYQSYICHMPRGIVELALDKHFEGFDGFVFPSICDVMRNLSGMFKILKVGTFVKYLDFPQNFKPDVGGEFYITEMNHILELIQNVTGKTVSPEALNHSISLYNQNRNYIEEIYTIRQSFPWRLSAEDTYHIVRAGMVMPVEDHNEILKKVLGFVRQEMGTPMDKIRVVVSGSFCEQPPIGLIKTIEMAGCYIVDDDFLLGSRWMQEDVMDNSKDPLEAMSTAYLNHSAFSSSIYDNDDPKEDRLLDLIKMRKADGVIFAAPSFCDPALLDNPLLQKACDDNRVRSINITYHENTGQFKVIKEQVGAFSDSIKLWDEPVLL